MKIYMNCLKTGKKLLKAIFLSSYKEKTPPIHIIFVISLASMLTKVYSYFFVLKKSDTCILSRMNIRQIS